MLYKFIIAIIFIKQFFCNFVQKLHITKKSRLNALIAKLIIITSINVACLQNLNKNIAQTIISTIQIFKYICLYLVSNVQIQTINI